MNNPEFCVFVHDTATVKINECLKATGKFQIIVSPAKDGYEIDIEPDTLVRIEMMGKEMLGFSLLADINEFVKNRLGIDIWEHLTEQMEEEIRLEGGIESFVNLKTGMMLPALSQQ